jgi:hypothetical protein
MPEVNGSIPASVNVPQNDLFGTLGKALAVKQGMLQNQMLQQDFAARRGSGEAYQAAIDPNSGELDTNKLLGIASADPRIAYKAGELVREAQERKLQQAGISSAQAKSFNDHLGIVGASLSSLLAGDDFSRDAIVGKAAGLLGNSAIAPELRKGMQGDVVALIQQLGDDPAANKQILTQLMVQNLGAQERIAALFGAPQTINTGGQTQVVAPSAVTGKLTQVGAPIQNTMDPATATQPTPVMTTDAQGNPVQAATTRAQFAQGAQQAGALPTGVAMPGGLPLGTLAETVTVIDPVTKQPKVITKGELLGIGNGSGVHAPTTGGGVATGLAPGQGEALAAQGTESAKQGVQLQQQADAAPARRAALLSMRDQLANFETGPAADKMAHVSALAREFGLPAPVSKEGVKATEEFNKLSTQIVLQQVAQLGGAGTDDKLAAGIKGNPSTYLSKLGNKAVTALMLGNEDAISAKNEAWQKWQQAGKGPETYGSFSTQFNRIYDPRVFQAKYMDPKDRAAMIKNMSPAEKKRYDDHVRVAVQAGWIVP